ncbi:MAG: metallophosphoesterase family protein [Candidatus Omnitrophota bacterium]|nr:metallophosphoesterase family protein [Candidatus Omnitrophota bacterium]
MRYAILGDIHSNLEALTAVMRSLAGERIDRYFSVGDLVGYAANPKECIRIFRGAGGISVAGNHDWASVNLFGLENFKQEAQEALNWTMRNLTEEEKDFLTGLKLVFKNDDFTLAHGSLNNPRDFNYLSDGYAAEETFRLMESGICFVGHTHIAGIFIKSGGERIVFRSDELNDIMPGNKYIVNVGSVGQPRDSNIKAAYCIFDSAAKQIQIKRVDYDVDTARGKIIDNGLPKFFGERLLLGR